MNQHEHGGPDAFAFVDTSVDPHRGKLTPRDVGRGVLATHRNARRLFRDAMLLLENGRNASAVSTAILAHEEAGKPMTIGMLGFDVLLPPLLVRLLAPQVARIRKREWKKFEDHIRKNATTLELHRMAGNFPPEVREAIERTSTESIAKDYVRVRERATYVDCVVGAERWSMPEMLIDRETALDMMRAIRRALGRIPTPAQVAVGVADVSGEMVGLLGDQRTLRALREWSESPEARELSALDLGETGDFVAEMDAAFSRLESSGTEIPGAGPS